MFRKIANSDLTSKQRQVNQIKYDILSDFEDTPSFEQVDINGISREVHIVSDKKDNKVMLSKPDEIFSVGDVVGWNGLKFLVVDIDENQQIQTRGTIQLCNNTLTFYQNHISSRFDIPCIVVDRQSIGQEDNNKYFSTIDCDILVIVSKNETTNLISPNDTFKIGRWNYSVVKPDDITKPGLIVLPMKFSEVEQPIPSYSLTILNGDLIAIQQGNTVQLNIEVKDGTTILTSPPSYLFTSSDENILIADANGLVTSVGIGTAIITCKLQSDETINDSISITVEEVSIPETYTLEITGTTVPDTEIKLSQTSTFTCIKKNNLNEVVEGIFDFSINPETTPSSAYTFTVLNDTQCTIKCNDSVYYINLIATDRNDNTLTVSKRIKLKSIF